MPHAAATPPARSPPGPDSGPRTACPTPRDQRPRRRPFASAESQRGRRRSLTPDQEKRRPSLGPAEGEGSGRLRPPCPGPGPATGAPARSPLPPPDLLVTCAAPGGPQLAAPAVPAVAARRLPLRNPRRVATSSPAAGRRHLVYLPSASPPRRRAGVTPR